MVGIDNRTFMPVNLDKLETKSLRVTILYMKNQKKGQDLKGCIEDP